MPKDKTKAPSKEQKKPAQKAVGESRSGAKAGMLKYAAAIIIVVVIIGAAIFAGLYASQNQEGSFDAFKANFNSAQRVAIVVTAYNGTVLSGTVGCATAIILQIASNPNAHRNTSTIDFGIINQSSCLEAKGLLGNGPNPNYTTTSVQNCVNLTTSEPAIYINYSATMNNTVIKPRLLYIVGTSTFLRQCGIAAEIS
ncbi:MAG: hypothetical protein ABSE71_05195 [Candidatus Micrarchaeaceae archaeon]|jgi:hypothetical protein|nr:hypothetical protein [Candidatus Micrarchaeota archaeon]HII09902.1 hypothetical protein [Candidatus Micrarchaeota archaeon]